MIKSLKAKKLFTLLMTCFVCGLTLISTSCITEYNPAVLKVYSEKNIIKKVNSAYKINNVTFTKIRTEEIFMKDTSYTDDVPEKNLNDICIRTVYLSCDKLPGVEIKAESGLTYGGYFYDHWDEYFCCDFYSYFYKDEMNKKYAEILKDKFYDFDYKMVKDNTVNSYLLDPVQIFKNFDKFLEGKDSCERYYVLVKSDYNADAERQINALQTALYQKDTLTNTGTVSYKFCFDASADLSEFTTEKITEYNFSDYEAVF